MTTIACDRVTMASDSMCADNQSFCSVAKIFRIRGALVGVAGTFAPCAAFINWLRSKDEDQEPPDMEGVYALLLNHEGIWMYDAHPTPFEVKDGFAAIGSGCQAALAAMHCGASPQMAVKVAAKVDANTGGAIVKKYLRALPT